MNGSAPGRIKRRSVFLSSGYQEERGDQAAKILRIQALSSIGKGLV